MCYFGPYCSFLTATQLHWEPVCFGVNAVQNSSIQHFSFKQFASTSQKVAHKDYCQPNKLSDLCVSYPLLREKDTRCLQTRRYSPTLLHTENRAPSFFVFPCH